MGRRRRNQDSTQAVDADQTVLPQDGQLQVVPTPGGVETQSEIKSATKQVEEIPYDDRPIPEAYFPPEDEEQAQEFMPEPNIQKSIEQTKKYKEVSKKDFEALVFEIKRDPVKTDPIPSVAKDDTSMAKTADSLIAKNDSLVKDSIVFVPVQEPEPKREIISIDGKEMPQTINNMWWYPLSLLVVFIAYVIIIRDRKKAILSELISFVKPNTDGSIFGFQWLQNSKYKFFLSMLGVISVSLFLFLANKVAISAIWIFFLSVTVFVVGKKLMLALLEYIYFEGADVESMSGAFMVMVRQTGLALIPSVLGLSFAPEEYRTFFIYFGIIVVVIAFLAFNLKVIVNFLRGITSIFYLILYLCTLEVIPVAIFFVLGLLPRL